MPLGQNDRRLGQEGLPDRPQAAAAPKVEAKVVYESKPVVRDLRKEAVAFVPAAVRVKMEKVKGIGGLLEPEEAEELERQGYMGSAAGIPGPKKAMVEEVEDEDGWGNNLYQRRSYQYNIPNIFYEPSSCVTITRIAYYTQVTTFFFLPLLTLSISLLSLLSLHSLLSLPLICKFGGSGKTSSVLIAFTADDKEGQTSWKRG